MLFLLFASGRSRELRIICSRLVWLSTQSTTVLILGWLPDTIHWSAQPSCNPLYIPITLFGRNLKTRSVEAVMFPMFELIAISPK